MRFFFLIVIVLPLIALSQIGGDGGYQVLNLSTNARTAALAGTTISISDGDISQFFENPAILDSTDSGDVFFNINPYFAGAILFSAAYATDVKNFRNFTFGLNYLDYGTFDRTDASGNLLGEFTAQEYIVTMGKAHKLGPIILGLNLKLLHASIDSYGSTSIAGDIGGIFKVNTVSSATAEPRERRMLPSRQRDPTHATSAPAYRQRDHGPEAGHAAPGHARFGSHDPPSQAQDLGSTRGRCGWTASGASFGVRLSASALQQRVQSRRP